MHPCALDQSSLNIGRVNISQGRQSSWKMACSWSKEVVFYKGLNICQGSCLVERGHVCGEKGVFSVRVLIYVKGGNMVYLWSKEDVFS